VKEREHEGDCWFGFGIPHLEYVGQRTGILTGDRGIDDRTAVYRIVAPPYARPVPPS
jgi:hypothetical protein